MPYVQLIDLFCQQTEDDGTPLAEAEDEIYFYIGARKIGPRDVSVHQPWLLIDHTPVKFSTSVTISMYDEDGGFFDSDDFLGQTVVSRDMVGVGEQRAVFDLDDANYTLTYKVENNLDMVPSYSVEQLLQIAMANPSESTTSPVVKTVRRNYKYLDISRNQTLDFHEFQAAIEAGQYPDYMLSKTAKGIAYAKAKSGTFPVLDYLIDYVGKRVDKYPIEKILSTRK
jgi:hypothetical protein